MNSKHKTLEMDSGHKNKKITFYQRSLRPLSRISCVLDDSHMYMQKELLVRSTGTPSAASLRFVRNTDSVAYFAGHADGHH